MNEQYENKSINSKTKANQELVMGTRKSNSNIRGEKRTLQLYNAAVSEFVKQNTFYLEVNTSEWLIMVQ